MCSVDPGRLASDAEYQELYTQEYHTKGEAITALGLLLKNCVSKRVFKMAGAFVSNAVEFFYVKSGPPVENAVWVRKALFEVMLELPCQYYQGKIVTVLH